MLICNFIKSARPPSAVSEFACWEISARRYGIEECLVYCPGTRIRLGFRILGVASQPTEQHGGVEAFYRDPQRLNSLAWGSKMRRGDTVHLILKHKGGEIWSVSPDQSVYEAIEKMADKEVGALLVISEGKLVGVVSERDYARKVILKGRSSKDTLVKEIMTSQVMHINPHQSVDECMNIMTNHRIRHLPVMEAEQLVGMISIGDLVKWIITEQEETIKQLEHYIAGSFPA